MMGTAKKQWTPEDDDMAQMLRERDCTYSEIADMMGRSRSSVKNRLSRRFGPSDGSGNQVMWTDEEYDRLRRYWPAFTKSQVAKEQPRMWARHGAKCVDSAASRIGLHKTVLHKVGSYADMPYTERDRLYCLVSDWRGKGADAEHIVSCIQLQMHCRSAVARSILRDMLQDYGRRGTMYASEQ